MGSMGKKDLVQTNPEADQVDYEETNDLEHLRAEVARSEHWSSSKTVGFIKISADANKAQASNRTRRFGKLMKNCQQLSPHARTRAELPEMHLLSVKLEPSSRHSLASPTKGYQRCLNSRVSQITVVHLVTVNPGMDHYIQVTCRMIPLR